MRVLLCILVLATIACKKAEETPESLVSPILVSESTNQSVVLGGSTLTFSAAGGTGPYTFSVSAGGGTINSSAGVYTASSLSKNDTITATDSAGNVGSMKVTSPRSPGLWLKADAGVTSAAGVVSLWADQSGNGNDFSQSNASMRPTLTTFGSFSAIAFNGTTNGLASSANSGLNLLGDSSVFFVVQITGCDPSSSNVQNTLLFQGAGTATAGTHLSSVFCPMAGNPSGTLGIARPWGTDGAPSSAVGYGVGPWYRCLDCC